ncbi:hypothetical protein NRK68_31380 [Streptomyces yangpuensis]|uniref:Uncharacterized protein n=1 Tax=Streptomyces yangpuensis TaxID=1648182 RepID=A0ABY5Q654_9ACTN|nr:MULTISPECIES: hypothetical protein [Streptomyces]MBZ9599774.1 hypothetical protein [Streptomyces erythrochromogenes]UUY51338.1 hypothetical protein NRK68_31380 [Streptomyces yangpuensis]
MLGDAVGYQITRECVGAFFELHLCGKQAPRLDGPTASAPEVRFHRG